MDFGNIISNILTIVFVYWPIHLTFLVVSRYRDLQKSVNNYSVALEISVSRFETNAEVDLEDLLTSVQLSSSLKSNESPVNEIQSNTGLDYWIARIQGFSVWIAKPLGHAENSNSKMDVEFLPAFIKYYTVVRNGKSDNESLFRFKSKNLDIRKHLLAHLEYCRTSTETLPYIGILGTVLGFVFSIDRTMIATDETRPAGLMLAMISTAVALICILFIKLRYEREIVPKYIQLESSLQTLEDFKTTENNSQSK